MGQFFTDDIDSLIKSGHGDLDKLARIKSDFESTKLVSIDDRKYVEGLIARYIQVSDSPKPEKTVKIDRKSTRLNSSHIPLSRMPSSA